jgi:UDP-glucose 4-epimerase
VILGGAGFIGSHLAEALLARGHQVTLFDKVRSDPANVEHLEGKVRFLEGDFLNPADVERALEGAEAVFHLVSTTLPAPSNLYPEYDVLTNAVSSVRLLDLCVARRVRKVVFISSGGTVYGVPKRLPIAEDHPTEPICSYGITKLAIEKYLALYRHLHGLDYTVLRFSNPYGERQDPGVPQGALTVFTWKGIRGEEIEIWGDGSVVRDYVYVGDAVEAFALALEREAPSRLYNVGSGRGVSLLDLVAAIRAATGLDLRVRHLPPRPIDVPANVLDVSRAAAELGWSARTPLAEGIRRTAAWLRTLPPPVPGPVRK